MILPYSYARLIGIVRLLIYVDDIIITGTDSLLIKQLQQHLQASFHMKDLDFLQYFLGLEVKFDLASIILYQHTYTQDLIALARLQDASSADIPLEVNVKHLCEEGELLFDPSMYRRLGV